MMAAKDPLTMMDSAPPEQSAPAIGFYNVRLSARDAWIGATAAAFFNALGMLLEIAIIRRVPGISAKPAGISTFVAVILLIVLYIRRKSPSVHLAYFLYMV